MPCPYHVYILTNAWNTVFYVGMARNLARRMDEHKMARMEGSSKRYCLTKLVHMETYTDVHEAIAREKRLKRWRRAWKEALIREGDPDFLTLWTEADRPF